MQPIRQAAANKKMKNTSSRYNGSSLSVLLSVLLGLSTVAQAQSEPQKESNFKPATIEQTKAIVQLARISAKKEMPPPPNVIPLPTPGLIRDTSDNYPGKTYSAVLYFRN
jgi:hypothetical protein